VFGALIAMTGSDVPSSELTPGMLFREIGDLRGDLRNLTIELRGVAEAMLKFRTQVETQDLGSKVIKLEDRIGKMESFQLKATGAFGLLGFLITLLMLWLQYRKP